jgi:hypothetical protein
LDSVIIVLEPNRHINQPAYLRDGRIVSSYTEAIAYVRAHVTRPGVDIRDEVLHKLERAQTRHSAAEAFLAWLEGLDLLLPPPETAERR